MLFMVFVQLIVDGRNGVHKQFKRFRSMCNLYNMIAYKDKQLKLLRMELSRKNEAIRRHKENLKKAGAQIEEMQRKNKILDRVDELKCKGDLHATMLANQVSLKELILLRPIEPALTQQNPARKYR